MTDDRIEPTPEMSRALMRGMTQRRLSRRQLIKVGGVSVGALSLSWTAAAAHGPAWLCPAFRARSVTSDTNFCYDAVTRCPAAP